MCTWYVDCDGDTYAELQAVSVDVGCSEPNPSNCGGGWTLTPPQGSDIDCNDDDPQVHPGASEVCDDEDNDCDGKTDELDECSITCDWTGARWLSHGWDGGAAFQSGGYFSCMAGKLSHVEWVAAAGTSANPSAQGTADAWVGCDWSGDEWLSQGIDGGMAFTVGADVTCAPDGNQSRVTAFSWSGTSQQSKAATAGNLDCNWTGARHFSQGWDGGCAFSDGLGVTCQDGKITHFQLFESCG